MQRLARHRNPVAAVQLLLQSAAYHPGLERSGGLAAVRVAMAGTRCMAVMELRCLAGVRAWVLTTAAEWLHRPSGSSSADQNGCRGQRDAVRIVIAWQ